MVRQLLGLLLCLVVQLHGGEGQVFQNSHVRVQVELLEHHAGGLAHEPGLILPRQLLPVNVNMAAGGLLQKVHAAHRGGLARTGRPDDDQLFALGHFQVDILQNVKISEVFLHMFQLDHFAFPFSHFISLKASLPCRANKKAPGDSSPSAFAFDV